MFKRTEQGQKLTIQEEVALLDNFYILILARSGSSKMETDLSVFLKKIEARLQKYLQENAEDVLYFNTCSKERKGVFYKTLIFREL